MTIKATTIRTATVNCPHCGHQFIVKDTTVLAEDRARKLSKATKSAMDEMHRALAKLFDPELWK